MVGNCPSLATVYAEYEALSAPESEGCQVTLTNDWKSATVELTTYRAKTKFERGEPIL